MKIKKILGIIAICICLISSTYAVTNAETYYTIYFNANGGVIKPDKVVGEEGAEMTTFPTPTREGYTFEGWYEYSVDGPRVYYFLFNRNFTVYAHWIANQYTVKCDANGGLINGASSSNITTTYDSTYPTLPTPTRTGYTFDGWYTEKNGGNAITTSVVYNETKDITIYAHWTANKYKVVYNSNKPQTATSSISGGMSVSEFTYGTSGKLSENNFTLPGYTFKCWNTRADGKGTSYSNGTTVSNLSATNGESVNLYALWNKGTANTTFYTSCQYENGEFVEKVVVKQYESDSYKSILSTIINLGLGYDSRYMYVDGFSAVSGTSGKISNDNIFISPNGDAAYMVKISRRFTVNFDSANIDGENKNIAVIEVNDIAGMEKVLDLISGNPTYQNEVELTKQLMSVSGYKIIVGEDVTLEEADSLVKFIKDIPNAIEVEVSSGNNYYSTGENKDCVMSYNKKTLYAVLNRVEEFNIPETIEVIGSRAFMNCENIEYIEIPSTVKYIYSDAFFNSDSDKIVLNPFCEISEDSEYTLGTGNLYATNPSKSYSYYEFALEKRK